MPGAVTRKLKHDGGDLPPSHDCAVIGAGPAGLTGALYLARFRRSVVVFDGGPSRAHWIPESHNCPGFPGGTSGDRLLERLRDQLSGYGARMCATRIESLARHEQGFRLVDADGHAIAARKVLLATGILDVLPNVDWVEAAIGVGALRLYPVCDGYEASDQRIAGYGSGELALNHAEFLRTYSADVTLFWSDGQPADDAVSRRAAILGVRIITRAGDLFFFACLVAPQDATARSTARGHLGASAPPFAPQSMSSHVVDCCQSPLLAGLRPRSPWAQATTCNRG